jgi:hypothetical protein
MTRLPHALLLFSLLPTVACAHWGAAASPTSGEPPAFPAPALRATTLGFSGVYGGTSSGSVYDKRVIDSSLMDRVLFEPGVLEEENPEGRVEAWTRLHLLRWLISREALLHVAPLPAAMDPRAPCPEGGCGEPVPTAVLHHLRFVSAVDEFHVVVVPAGSFLTPVLSAEGEADRDSLEPSSSVDATARYEVELRQDPKQPSLCEPEMGLQLGFAQIQVIVQRLADGALAAQVSEMVLLSGPKEPSIKLALPDPEEDRATFCRGIVAAYDETEALQPSDAGFVKAADLVLQKGMGRLFPVDEP